jgi:hypothetical protein
MPNANRYFASLAAALALCGCNQQPATPQAQASAKAALAEAIAPRPGLYRATVRVTKFEIPGMPAAQAERMKGMFSGTGNTRENCVTPAMVAHGYREMVKQNAQGRCTFDRYSENGGRIDGKLTCQTARGASATVEIAGTATAEGSTLHMKMEQAPPPGAPPAMRGVRMEMEVASQRIGDCPA